MSEISPFDLPAVAAAGPASPIIRPTVVKTCGMCTAFVPNNPGSKFGACCANPPVPLLVGVGQGLDGKPRPLVDSYRSMVGFDTPRCRNEFEQIDDAHPSMAVDFVTDGTAQ